jgi:hypothetical protein
MNLDEFGHCSLLFQVGMPLRQHRSPGFLRTLTHLVSDLDEGSVRRGWENSMSLVSMGN